MPGKGGQKGHGGVSGPIIRFPRTMGQVVKRYSPAAHRRMAGSTSRYPAPHYSAGRLPGSGATGRQPRRSSNYRTRHQMENAIERRFRGMDRLYHNFYRPSGNKGRGSPRNN